MTVVIDSTPISLLNSSLVLLSFMNLLINNMLSVTLNYHLYLKKINTTLCCIPLYSLGDECESDDEHNEVSVLISLVIYTEQRYQLYAINI